MAKKKKRFKQSLGNITIAQSTEVLLALISTQLIESDYMGVVETCQRLLSKLPQGSQQRAEVLGYLGTAYEMLQDFPQAYEVLTEALTINPHDGDLWFNRGLASRFTARSGQSVRDFERAVELMDDPKLTRGAEKELAFSKKLARESIKLRGPNFTLDQLIEQEELFQRGLRYMEASKWEEAEQALKRLIEMGDCLPQPWGNLGLALMMQRRYDEAEAAWKRALVIDKHYALARNNLAMLPELRKTGNPHIDGSLDPFKGRIKQSLKIHR